MRRDGEVRNLDHLMITEWCTVNCIGVPEEKKKVNMIFEITVAGFRKLMQDYSAKFKRYWKP